MLKMTPQTEKTFNMKKFKVNDRIYLPRTLNGVWTQVHGEGMVKEVTDTGYTVLFDDGATIHSFQDHELEPVISDYMPGRWLAK